MSSENSGGGEWLMDKLGEWTSPLDQADGASRGLHFVQSGVTFGDAHSAVMVGSEDVPLARWSYGSNVAEQLVPFPTPLRGSNLVSTPEQVSFVLFNNAWNTNFCAYHWKGECVHRSV